MADGHPSLLARNFEALNIQFQNGDDRITEEEIDEDLEGEQGTIPDLVAADLEPENRVVHEEMEGICFWSFKRCYRQDRG